MITGGIECILHATPVTHAIPSEDAHVAVKILPGYATCLNEDKKLRELEVLQHLSGQRALTVLPTSRALVNPLCSPCD